MLGAGLIKSDIGLYSIGTTEAIVFPSNHDQNNFSNQKINTYPHVIANESVVLTGSQNGSRVLEWFKKIRRIDRVIDLDQNLPDLPSSVLVIPHFSGSGLVLADQQARGTFLDLSFETTPQDLTHAIMEGITFDQALAVKYVQKHGISWTKLRAVGGGSKSSFWMQMKADIIGIPIETIVEKETACTGAAILAGVGSRVIASLETAVKTFVNVERIYQPRPSYHRIYIEKLSLYEKVYLSLKQHQSQHTSLTTKIQELKKQKLKDRSSLN